MVVLIATDRYPLIAEPSIVCALVRMPSQKIIIRYLHFAYAHFNAVTDQVKFQSYSGFLLLANDL